MPVRFMVPLICGGLLAACDLTTDLSPQDAEQAPASAQEVEVTEAQPAQTAPAETSQVAERKTATIDWNAARADFAARDTEDGIMAQVASGGAVAVPVLLPEEPVGIASTGADALQFRPLADGYFAVKPGEVYDLIINGTDRLVVRPEDVEAASETALTFEETMTGAQVSFSRYGASYLVEFMCKDPATAAKGSCVSEADALAEVETLLIAGTR